MYEPDLARVKRLLAYRKTSDHLFTTPDTLPAAMKERGYRLESGVLYWDTLPLSDMSAKGVLRLFEEVTQ